MRLERHWEKGIKAIYLNSMLRNMAGAVAGIFLPIYIYQWGGLKAVAVLVLLERGLVTMNSLLLGKFVVKIGYKWSVLLSSLLFALFYILIASFSLSYQLIVVISVVTSLIIPLYWLPRLSIMAVDGDKKDMGEEVGLLQLVEKASSILGPLLGGVVLSIFGFKYLFVLVAILSIISSVPIFFVRNYQLTDGVSIKGFINYLMDPKNRHLIIAFWGQGWANLVDAYFWPIYFFLAIGSFTIFGGIASLTFATSTIMVFVAGKLFDVLRSKKGSQDENEYTLSTIVVSMIQLARPFIKGVMGLFALDTVFSLVLPFWSIDYDSYLYNAGKKNGGALVFYTYREIWYSLSRFVGGSILLISFIFGVSWWSWVLIFTMGGIGTLLTLGMQKES